MSDLDTGNLNRNFEPVSAQLDRCAVVGRWYNATTVQQTGRQLLAFTQSKLFLSLPRYAHKDIKIDQLAVDTTAAGSTGAFSRMGVYLPINQVDAFAVVTGTAWATLLAEAGTVTTDAATGVRPITPGSAIVIPQGTYYSIAHVAQGAAPATYWVNTNAGGSTSAAHTPWGGSAAFSTEQVQLLSATGVTGALPTTFTPTAFEPLFQNSDHGVQFRRA